MTDISDPIQSISTNDTQKAEVEDIELINYVLGTKTSKSIFTVKILNFITFVKLHYRTYPRLDGIGSEPANEIGRAHV